MISRHSIVLSIVVLLVGCKNNPVESMGPPLDPYKVLGNPAYTKTYSFTSADFIQATNEPYIVPPDSLKSSLQFPESLYSQGIFLYGELTEECWFNSGTLVVTTTGHFFNLFVVISNWYLQTQTNGEVGSWSQNKYMLLDGNKIYQVSDDYRIREIVYHLPLTVGEVYHSEITTAVFSVLSEETITTKAGTFDTFKIQVAGRWGAQNLETYFISPEYGLVSSVVQYVSPGYLPWDSENHPTVVQIQRTDLISISQNK